MFVQIGNRAFNPDLVTPNHRGFPRTLCPTCYAKYEKEEEPLCPQPQ